MHSLYTGLGGLEIIPVDSQKNRFNKYKTLIFKIKIVIKKIVQSVDNFNRERYDGPSLALGTRCFVPWPAVTKNTQERTFPVLEKYTRGG